MFQTVLALGLLLLGFLAADWISLQGYGYLIAIAYVICFTPLLIREIIKLVKNK